MTHLIRLLRAAWGHQPGDVIPAARSGHPIYPWAIGGPAWNRQLVAGDAAEVVAPRV